MATILDARTRYDLKDALSQAGWNVVRYGIGTESATLTLVEAPHAAPHPSLKSMQIHGTSEEAAMREYLNRFEQEHGPQSWSPVEAVVISVHINPNAGPINHHHPGTGTFVVSLTGDGSEGGYRVWSIVTDDIDLIGILQRAHRERVPVRLDRNQLTDPIR